MARAQKLATCVGPFVALGPTVEATAETVSWSKLRGAVVELCSETSEAILR